jgi:hypothetical protein
MAGLQRRSQTKFRHRLRIAELPFCPQRRTGVFWYPTADALVEVTSKMRKLVLFLGIAFGAFGSVESAENPPKLIAEGKWSKPVADTQGYALRGRLVLCEKPAQDNMREVAVYVELQEASDFIGGPMQIYCDLGKHDFRPEYKSGLNCELRDGMNNLVPPAPFAFSGAVPLSEWVKLPKDGTIRLRASPFGIRRAGAKAICPHLGSLWVIADEDTKDYFLAGTFFVAPSADNPAPKEGHAWKGTIELPAVRITNKKP